MNEKNTGTLYIVSTPIGNLEDISLRALRILKEVDIITAEDTRQTVKLLNHYNIKKPLESYFEHNKASKGDFIIGKLLEGKNIALVSDAGTPGISDPGEDLVNLAIKEGISYTVIPGPVAAIAGLVLSGLSAKRFVFEGFLPMKNKIRKQRIAALKKETRTIILYEAPHKMIETLKDLTEGLGERNVAIAREITKIYEQVFRCTLAEAVERYSINPPRGEFVIIIEGLDENELLINDAKQWNKMTASEHVDMYINYGEDKRDAIKMTAEDRRLSRREVYNEYTKNK